MDSTQESANTNDLSEILPLDNELNFTNVNENADATQIQTIQQSQSVYENVKYLEQQIAELTRDKEELKSERDNYRLKVFTLESELNVSRAKERQSQKDAAVSSEQKERIRKKLTSQISQLEVQVEKLNKASTKAKGAEKRANDAEKVRNGGFLFLFFFFPLP